MKILYGIFSRASLAGGSASGGILSRRTISVPVLIAAMASMVLAIVVGYLTASLPLIMMAVLLATFALSWSVVRWPYWGLVLILVIMSTVALPEHLYWLADVKAINWTTDGLMLLIVVSSAIYWVRNHPEVGIFQRLFASPQSIAIAIFCHGKRA